MTYPTPPETPWTPNPVRPGPPGTARAGAMTGYTNLATDLDAGFASFNTWAARMRADITPTLWNGGSAMTGFTANWGFYSSPALTVFRRVGRMVFGNWSFVYNGTITSNASGDVSPDMPIVTLISAALKPAGTDVYVSCPIGGAGGGIATVQIAPYPSGTFYLTGLSTASFSVNSPVLLFGTASWLGA